MIDLVAAFAAGYFVGALPFAYWLAKLRGHDIFAVGSGNMGAMNSARHVGKAVGVAVLLLDLAKGATAAVVGGWMAGQAGSDPLAATLAAGMGAVVGHAWSAYVRFRGGKALATMLGAILVVSPWVGGYALATLIALLLLTRRAQLAAIVTLLLYPFLTVTVLLRHGWTQEHAFAVGTAAGLAAIVSLVKHLRSPSSPAGDDRPRPADPGP
ncbi:MAG: glycerol-3-phosphate acyltransferase [Trueperaceae bacterium]